MVATRPGDDPVPRAGEGSSRRTTTQLASDPAFTNTYASRLRQRIGWGPAVTAKRNTLWSTAALATAPTITAGTVFAASTITSPVYVLLSDARLRVNGGAPGMLSAQFVGNNGTTYYSANTLPLGSGGSDFVVDFTTDAPVFEVDAARNATFTVWVDGVRTTTTPTAVTVSGSSQYYIKFDFGSRAVRHVTLVARAQISRLVIGPNDTIFPTTAPKPPRFVIVADSIGQVSTPTWNVQAGPYGVAAKLLGWDDYFAGAVGGTGYLNNGTSFSTFRQRLPELAALSPDILGTFGGINDQGRQTRAVLQAETTAYFAAARSALPNTLLLATGPWAPKTSLAVSSSYTDVRDAILGGIQTVAGDWLFVDTLTGGWTRSDGATGAATGAWITGEGRNGTTTGTGNADLYISSDATHPPEAGAIYAGHRLAHAVSEALAY